jgi:type IV secretion system protein VirB9
MHIPLAILVASVAVAAVCPQAVAEDPARDTQIRVVSYSPLKRTEIIGVVGQPTTITFPRGESIYRVVQSGRPDKDGTLADAGWQGASPAEVKDTPLGNNLTLWPVVPGESTMTVITMSPEGSQKVYPFRLVAKPDAPAAMDAPGVVLNLIFNGGAVPPAATQVATGPTAPAARVETARQRASQAEQEAAREHLRTDAFNGADGACHYVAKGKRPNEIEPRCPMDNGEWTLMRFPGLSMKPAVYVVNADNEERLARQHGAGDFVVVEEIARHFRLRLGPNVLDIINEAFDPAGKPAGTGTTALTVERDILPARH